MTVDCSQDLFEALEMVALVHREDGRFVLSGGMPRWFRKLWPDILPGSLLAPPEKQFPFLGNFLVDAREFWESGKKWAYPLGGMDPGGARWR